MSISYNQVVNTPVTSTTYVTVPSRPATSIVFLNNTGVDVNIKYRNGDAYLCKNDTFYQLELFNDTNECSVARASGSGAISVQALYFG